MGPARRYAGRDRAAEDVIFREIRDADLDALVALWEACGLTRAWNPPHRDIALLRESGHGAILLADEDGTLAGSVMVGHDGHRGWLYYLAVAPERQGSGLGRKLVGEAEAWLEARGIRKSMLLIRPENTLARGFYEAIGYEEEPRVLMTRWLKRD
jgi:ribosomal protein S18 acetylase RimI-like enzyme